ncbi:MAG: hypothetical protein KDD47_20200 [Acidobacteria bacterium]|nr:hypothetical protein [Acidobacteriota bacterium]
MTIESASMENVKALFLLLLTLSLASSSLAEGQASLAKAQELLDQGQAREALALLVERTGRGSRDAEAFLLRSTAYFMLGDRPRGEKDLDHALEIDPKLRQGWLNRAALHISDQQYDVALAALETAEKLDATAPDNELNIGAVLLLKGDLAAASRRFERYLTREENSAEAHYLVASNYALSGYVSLSVSTLRRAIELEERNRLRARTDSRFDTIAEQAPFQALLQEDHYQLPAGAYFARRSVAIGYDARDGRLLGAVIDALEASGLRFDPRVEVTDRWALIWGDLRIKVSGAADGGFVEISAPPESCSPTEWQRRLDSLAASLERLAGEQFPGGRSSTEP